MIPFDNVEINIVEVGYSTSFDGDILAFGVVEGSGRQGLVEGTK